MTENYQFNENLAIDEEIPEDTFAFTTNLDEWVEVAEDNIKVDYKFGNYDIPENLKFEILEYESKIREYIDGYITMPVFIYNKTSITCQRRREKTLEDVVSFVKELKENNHKVFLYWICYYPERKKDQVVEIDDYFLLRYGVA